MKNIHILPTDKLSRLFITDNKLFNYHNPQQGDDVKIINQHIYINSDEEISDFENNIWVILGTRVWLWKNTMALRSNNKPKKIILTTDKDLIKDGVQAIDDEFLEWFVKNPSCEEVKVVEGTFTVGEMSKLPLGTRNLKYKIIIPKEKTKQETLEEVAERMFVKEEQFIFKLGAKWQQGRSYSEEEVLPLLEMLQKCKEYFLLKTDLKSEERADAIGQVLEKLKNK